MGTGVSFFDNNIQDEDESISLNEEELNRITAENEQKSDSLIEEPDFIVIDKEDLNEFDIPEASEELQNEDVEQQNIDTDFNEDLKSEEVELEELDLSSLPETFTDLNNQTSESVEDVSSKDLEMSVEQEEQADISIAEPEINVEESSITEEAIPIEEEPTQAMQNDTEISTEISFEKESSEEIEPVPDLSIENLKETEITTSSFEEPVSIDSSDISFNEPYEKDSNYTSISEKKSIEISPEISSQDISKDEEEILPDEPSAIEEISSLPDIEEIEEKKDENLSFEVSPLNLEEKEKISFTEVEEIDLNSEPGEINTVIEKEEEEKKPTGFFSEEDEDESITLSSDELNNILESSTEQKISLKETAPEPVILQDTSTKISETEKIEDPLSKDNLKEILVYLDNLLEKLPEEEIRRFATSRYYDLYNAIFEELGIV